MKFKLKITKDVLRESARCGFYTQQEIRKMGLGANELTQNCAFAVAYRQLIPNVSVDGDTNTFDDREGNTIGEVKCTRAQKRFIGDFDEKSWIQRLAMPEEEFDVEIPDKVIQYWHEDAVKIAQAIANAPSLNPINHELVLLEEKSNG